MESIKSGEFWYDNNGELIQAHAGQIFEENGIYYLYGEDKSNMTADKPGEPYHKGIHFYSSIDFYNWKDEGVVVPAVDDINDPMDYRRIVDRPHVIKNEKTGKYVMWIKISGSPDKIRDWTTQRAYILTSDKLLGPYTPIKELLPNGQNMGDFDFVKDDKTGDMYIYFSHIVGSPSNVACMKLTEDYLGVENGAKYYFDYDAPPETRESPAFFKRNGKIYLSTSGCTGYHPNPSLISVANEANGPWKELGNICVGDDTKSTFHSQISCVFKHPQKKDLYIAIADRWLSDLDLSKLEWITNGYRTLQAKQKVETDLTWEQVWQYSMRNISLATYVWLPFKFDKNGKPYLEWRDEWTLEEFE